MRSKVSSDWLPSYIKATRPVPAIFKMAAYFTDRPRMMTLCADTNGIASKDISCCKSYREHSVTLTRPVCKKYTAVTRHDGHWYKENMVGVRAVSLNVQDMHLSEISATYKEHFYSRTDSLNNQLTEQLSLTLCTRVVIEKQFLTYSINSLYFAQPIGSLPHSQQPANCT